MRAATPLRARNQTPRRLGAARRLCRFHLLPRNARKLSTIQPDLTGHKLKPVRSFHIPECCETNADYLMIELIARTARTRIQYGSARFVYHRSELVSSFRISECCETLTRLFDDTAYCKSGAYSHTTKLPDLFITVRSRFGPVAHLNDGAALSAFAHTVGHTDSSVGMQDGKLYPV